MKDSDYADNLALLANTPAQAKYLLHNLKQAAKGIGLYVIADKTEPMCFKQEMAISTFSGKLQKLVDQFTSLDSNISSTESDVNIRFAKYRLLLTTYRSLGNLSHKIKRKIFQAVAASVILYGCTTRIMTKRTEKKLDGNCVLRAVLDKSLK